MKRVINNRRRKQQKAISIVKQRLLDKLTELAKGLTPPEMATAHVDYYFTCNLIEREILMSIFETLEDRVLTDIARYYEKIRNNPDK